MSGCMHVASLSRLAILMLPENVLLTIEQNPCVSRNCTSMIVSMVSSHAALQPCIVGQTFSNSSLYYQTN